jgi:hypothetical protein
MPAPVCGHVHTPRTRAVSLRTARRAISAAAAVLVVGACSGPVVTLEATVRRTVEAGPGRNSSDYRTPNPLQSHDLAGTVLAYLAGTEDPPVPDGVEAVEAVDSDRRAVRIVAEDVDGGGTEGLGLYAVREGTGAPAGLVIEVPHPRADQRTEYLGTELFTALDASALFVAGAHRTAGNGAADVTHEPASAFAAVDRAVVGRGTVVLQLHGFDESRHSGYAQIVLSSGESTPGSLVERLDRDLEDAGFDTCVYDGQRCQALGATRNVQAAHARTVGATFIHLELELDLREPGEERDTLVATLAEALSQ